MRTAINVAAFYAGWLVAVLLAARGWGLAAVAASVGVVVLHLLIDEDRQGEFRLIVIAAAFGLIAESLLIASGVSSYALGTPGSVVPPLWLVGLWMAFATTMNVSLAWLKSHIPLAALLGAFAGPASYFAGARLGAMTLAEPVWQSLLLIGVLWAVAFPVLIVAARRLRSN